MELCGKPMIGRLIDIFMDCGAESVSVIVNERMAQVREYLEQRSAASPVPLRVVVKSTPSSMHSFRELGRVMGRDGRFVLTTVDTIFRPDEFAAYVREFSEAPSDVDALMAVTGYVDDEKPLYVCADERMRVSASWTRPLPAPAHVSGGIYGLDGRAFEVLERCVERGVSRMRNFQRALLEEGLDVRARLFDKIIDVDHAGDIAKARAFVCEGGKSDNPQQICQR